MHVSQGYLFSLSPFHKSQHNFFKQQIPLFTIKFNSLLNFMVYIDRPRSSIYFILYILIVHVPRTTHTLPYIVASSTSIHITGLLIFGGEMEKKRKKKKMHICS